MALPRLRGAAVLLLPLLLAAGPRAWADGPALQAAPGSGGPGSQVALVGTGFCGQAGCAPVTVQLDGGALKDGIAPSPGGRFRVVVTIPGGLVPGEVLLVARQVLADGNETTAESVFVYSPSKGEAAEREAETRDALTNLINPSAPVAPPKGQPLASAGTSPGGLPPASEAASPTVGAPVAQAGRAPLSQGRWALVATSATAFALLLAWFSRVARRRHHPFPSKEST